MVSALFPGDELRPVAPFSHRRDGIGGLSPPVFAMIVAKFSARSNLFLPRYRYLAPRRDIYLWWLITQSRRRGSEKCPELKEARKRANIRSETIRARARIIPRRMRETHPPFLSILKRQPPTHTYFPRRTNRACYTSWRFILGNTIAFVDLPPDRLASGNRETHSRIVL